MSVSARPAARPANPCFSSGPCAKRPGWSPSELELASLGRSHRAAGAKDRLELAIEQSRAILGIPADYRVGILPGSDTGAFEAALWSLLGPLGIDVLSWESFGRGWVTDVVKQLKPADVRVLEADYGAIPDLSEVDGSRDVVFTWNGTTSGVRVPNADWIADDRAGLTICDATSAAFAQRLDWAKLDATTFSWQKALGGEAQHGMLVLSPRAAKRLESYSPPWPMPKLFRLTKSGKLDEAIFKGSTINTPSMLCVEDYLDALAWAEKTGGLDGLIARADSNLAALERWVEATPWIGFLAGDPATRSNTSVCLEFTDPAIVALPEAERSAFAKAVVSALEKAGVAFDIGAYRDAPPGLRIWCGATVETADVEALTAWIGWAYDRARSDVSEPA